MHNARVYRFPTATAKRGDGAADNAFEGSDQLTPVEDESHGELFGLISRRNGRQLPAGSAPPATSFTLKWRWESFRKDSAHASCHVAATFITEAPRRTSDIDHYALLRLLRDRPSSDLSNVEQSSYA